MKALKSNWTVPIVLAVALVLVMTATFALFTETKNGVRSFTLSNFTSRVEVAFNDNTFNTSNIVQGTTVGGATYFEASLNPNAANYIGKLCVRVVYQGKGVGLVRVRIAEEWYETVTNNGETYTDVKPYAIQIPYRIGLNNTGVYSGTGNHSKWFDNRANDYCFYYATPINSANNTPKNLLLIDGLDTSKIDFSTIDYTKTFVRIMIEADAVQVNRYPQFWGINALPWSGASSASENII